MSSGAVPHFLMHCAQDIPGALFMSRQSPSVFCAGISAENAILNVAILIVCIWVSRLYLCRQKYNCLLSYCSKIATKQLSTLPFSCSWNLCLKSSSQGRASAMTNGLDSNTTAQHYGNWVCQADSKLIINTSI